MITSRNQTGGNDYDYLIIWHFLSIIIIIIFVTWQRCTCTFYKSRRLIANCPIILTTICSILLNQIFNFYWFQYYFVTHIFSHIFCKLSMCVNLQFYKLATELFDYDYDYWLLIIDPHNHLIMLIATITTGLRKKIWLWFLIMTKKNLITEHCV